MAITFRAFRNCWGGRTDRPAGEALVLLSQKDIKRKPLENQIKVEIRAAARRRLG